MLLGPGFPFLGPTIAHELSGSTEDECEVGASSGHWVGIPWGGLVFSVALWPSLAIGLTEQGNGLHTHELRRTLTYSIEPTELPFLVYFWG